MVLTRARLRHGTRVERDELTDPLNLNNSSVDIVSNICMNLNKIKANHPEIEVGHLEDSIAQLVDALDEAESRGIDLETSSNTQMLEIINLEAKLGEEKSRRICILNESLTVQDMVLEEKDTIVRENNILMSKLVNLETKVESIVNERDLLQLKITDKDTLIEKLNCRIKECNSQIIKLVSNENSIKEKLKLANDNSWSVSRWVDDKTLDLYFEAFGNSETSVLSKTLYFGPSLTQIIRFSNREDISTLLNQISFSSSNYVMFCVCNNTDCSKQDSGSHWSLLFLDRKNNKAFHFDSLNKYNNSFANDILVKLNLNNCSLTEMECTKQNNNFECGINVLLYAKLINVAFCSLATGQNISFTDWYTNVILSPSNLLFIPSVINVNETDTVSPVSSSLLVTKSPLTSTPKLSETSEWVTVKTKARSKLHNQRLNGNSIRLSNNFSVLSSCNDVELGTSLSGSNNRDEVPNKAVINDNLLKNKNDRPKIGKKNTYRKPLCPDVTSNKSLPIDPKLTKSGNNSDTNKPKVRLLTDSHGRSLCSKLHFRLSSSYDVMGEVRPSAKLSTVTGNMCSMVNMMGKNDFLVVYGGTNDLVSDSGCVRVVVKQFEDIIRNTTDTNLIIVGLPLRFDKPYLNYNISKINNEIMNYVSNFQHAKFISVGSIFDRSYYTSLGLHLNNLGKVYVVSQIASALSSHLNCSFAQGNQRAAVIPVLITKRSGKSSGLSVNVRGEPYFRKHLWRGNFLGRGQIGHRQP